jgi:hypothetical protein
VAKTIGVGRRSLGNVLVPDRKILVLVGGALRSWACETAGRAKSFRDVGAVRYKRRL